MIAEGKLDAVLLGEGALYDVEIYGAVTVLDLGKVCEYLGNPKRWSEMQPGMPGNRLTLTMWPNQLRNLRRWLRNHPQQGEIVVHSKRRA